MNLSIIEHRNQRVLTTSQLTESFGADSKVITRNFQRNQNRYKHGKHYFSLTGDDLKEFKGSRQFDDSLKYASVLYLWTEKGAWLHAKSLNTDAAWDAYEMLVDDYYEIKQNEIDTSQLSPELQMFNGLFQSIAQQELATKQLETKVDGIRDVVALNTVDWRKDSRQLINKIAQSRGGYGAYQEVNQEIYKEVERRGGYQLGIRLTNKRRRLADEGVSKSRRDKLSKVDVIADDKRLIEIYVAVVKEFSIKHGVEKGGNE